MSQGYYSLLVPITPHDTYYFYLYSSTEDNKVQRGEITSFLPSRKRWDQDLKLFPFRPILTVCEVIYQVGRQNCRHTRSSPQWSWDCLPETPAIQAQVRVPCSNKENRVWTRWADEIGKVILFAWTSVSSSMIWVLELWWGRFSSAKWLWSLAEFSSWHQSSSWKQTDFNTVPGTSPNSLTMAISDHQVCVIFLEGFSHGSHCSQQTVKSLSCVQRVPGLWCWFFLHKILMNRHNLLEIQCQGGNLIWISWICGNWCQEDTEVPQTSHQLRLERLPSFLGKVDWCGLSITSEIGPGIESTCLPPPGHMTSLGLVHLSKDSGAYLSGVHSLSCCQVHGETEQMSITRW